MVKKYPQNLQHVRVNVLPVYTSNGRFVSSAEKSLTFSHSSDVELCAHCVLSGIKNAVQNLCEDVLCLKDPLLRLSRNRGNHVLGYHARSGIERYGNLSGLESKFEIFA